MKIRSLLSAAAILAIAPAFAADGTWNADADGNWSATTNWNGGIVADGTGATANFTGNITADRTVTLDGARTLTNLNFGNALSSSDWFITGANTLTLAGTTPTIAVSNNSATIAPIITGAAGLTKTGAGTLVLTGANTYTGNTAINGGTLQIGDGTNATNWSYAGSFGDQSSGAGTLSIAANSTLTITATANNQFMRANGSTLVVAGTLMGNTGTAQSLTNANTSAATVILKGGTITDSGSNSSGYGAFYINGNITFTVIGSGNLISGTKTLKVDNNTLTLATAQLTDALTVSTGLFGSGGIAKTGAGTVTLTGTNTYTGATTIAAGTLNLDFSASGAPASNIINNTALTLSGGGTLLLTGKASTANSQQFNGLSVGTGGGVVSLNANATANPLSLSLGAITRSTGGGVTFILPTGTQSASNGITTTAINDGAGLLGAWAFVSNGSTVNYATVSGGNIVAYTGGTAASDNDGLTDTTGTVNYDLAAATGSTAVGAAAFSANTIRYTGASGTTAPGTSFTVNGLMNAGTGRWTIGTNQLTIGANKDLVVNTASADMAITGILANNAGGASALTKTGTGTLTLSGANTYTGNTTINGGTLQVGDGTNATNWSYGGNFAGGGTLTVATASTLTLTAMNQYARATGAGLVVNGTLVIGQGQAQSIDNWASTGSTTTGTGTITLNNGTVTSGGTGAHGTYGGLLIGGSNWTINANGNANVISGVNTVGINNSTLILNTTQATDKLTVSTNILNAGGSGSITKSGAGTVIFTGANTYTGITTVSAGTLLINGTQSAATGAITVAVGATLGGVGTTGASLLTVNGTITGGTAATIGTLTANNVTLTSTGAYVAQIGSSTATADKLAVTGTLTLGGNLTLTDLDNTVVATGTKLTLASYSTITGSFVNAADGSLITVGDNQWRLAYNDALSANTLTLTAVPEPATYGLLGAGALAGIAFVRRRRRKMA